MGVCNCSMFCCTLLYVHFSIAIILMGKRELIALLNLSSWCLVMVERLFLTVPRGCLQFVIVVFPDHTHLLFLLYFIHFTWLYDFMFQLTSLRKASNCSSKSLLLSFFLLMMSVGWLQLPEPATYSCLHECNLKRQTLKYSCIQ